MRYKDRNRAVDVNSLSIKASTLFLLNSYFE